MSETAKAQTTAKKQAVTVGPPKAETDTSTPLEAVKAIANNMQDNLNDMLAACKTKQQRSDILDKFVAARHNYDDCINQAFHQNDAELDKLVKQANESAAEIKVIDTQLGNIAKVIGILTTAVNYGSAIVKKIITI